jgi:hypothetical protein
MPSLDRMNSYTQEQDQLESYQSTEYAQESQQWDGQGYNAATYDNQQAQQYDPSTELYIDQQYVQQEQVVFEQESEPVVPEPERIDDPLNRYLGCPLIAFGFGGNYQKFTLRIAAVPELDADDQLLYSHISRQNRLLVPSCWIY